MRFREIISLRRVFTYALLVPLLLACQRSNLFESKKETTVHNPIFGPSGETAIALEIIGNNTGAYRALIVETNGFVRYLDSLQFSGQATSALSQEEYGNLVALFLEKDFLHLEDRYESAFTPYAPRMQVQFRYGGAQKIVNTDSVSAPARLQEILARLACHMQTVQSTRLQLTIAADRDTILHGEEVRLNLKVTNPHAHAVNLLAREPLVDFFVFRPYDFEGNAPEDDYRAPFLWQTASSEVSTKIVQSFEMAAGESRVFQTIWRGEDRHGNLLEGTFAVAARFAAIPGGYSALRLLQVRKR